jgi:hypothetical protein
MVERILQAFHMNRAPSAAEKRRQAVRARRRETIAAYCMSEDLASEQIEAVVQLVDLYGLLHLVRPKRGTTVREIHRQAEAAARSQRKKTWHALRNVAPHERKAHSDAAAELARKKVHAQMYQRVRGSAVIPRYPNPQDRAGASTGRRPELEVTRFLQVGARYLKENCEHAPDHYEECLAGVLLRAEGNLHPSKSQVRKIKNNVHTRLMKAPVLEDFDYCLAIGQDPGEEWLPMSLQC